MEYNFLGIYIRENTATIALTNSSMSNVKLASAKLASTDEEHNSIGKEIAEKIAAVKTESKYKAVAVDCSHFTQHLIHSQFNDIKQISQTVKFDAEEVMATDILTKAIAFEVNRKTENGSDITIFAGQRTEFTKMLSDLQANKIDPVVIKPDVVSLVDFLNHKFKSKPDTIKDTVIVALSETRCYLINYDSTNEVPETRTFVTSSEQDPTSLLQRQIPLSLASFSRNSQTTKILLIDTTNQVNAGELSEKIGVQLNKIEIGQLLPAAVKEELNALDAMIAVGAAIENSAKESLADFRLDFAPYLGKRQAFEKTLKIISVIAAIILLATGVFFQIKVIQKSDQIKKAKIKLTEEAKLIIPKKKLEKSKESVSSILKREIVKLSDQKSGKLTLEAGSIEAKLNFILEAINSLPKNVNLNIETIEVSQRSMRLTGDTDSSRSTLKLFDAIKKHKELVIDERSSKTTAGRNKFRVTIRDAN